jgi:hypothetical protein
MVDPAGQQAVHEMHHAPDVAEGILQLTLGKRISSTGTSRRPHGGSHSFGGYHQGISMEKP